MLEISDGEVHARAGAAADPDASLSGSPYALLGVLSGQLDLATARSQGLELRGDEKVIRRMQPLAGCSGHGSAPPRGCAIIVGT